MSSTNTTEASRQPSLAGQRRVEFIDVVKGLAIVLVVYGHAFRGLVNAAMIAAGSPLFVIDYVIYAAHMPVFFFLSGLFFEQSLKKGAGKFWSGRAKTIVYPYLLWSVLQGSVQVMISGTGATNGGMTWARLGEILWSPLSPFWFLYALFFANLFAYVIRSITPSRTGMLVALALSFAAFLLSFRFPNLPVLNDVTYAIFYFLLGCVTGLAGVRRLISMAGRLWMPFMLCYVGGAIGCFMLSVPERLPLPAAFLGLAAFLATGALIERSSFERLHFWLQMLGACSMGIFVLHILVIGFTRAVLVRLFHIDQAGVLLVLLTVTGVLVPSVVVTIAHRLRIGSLLGIASTGLPSQKTAHMVPSL